MCSGAGHTTRLVRGSPIRTSSDQRSVGSSPRLIAASYVLHRLLVPRHPPCALNNLATQPQHTPHPPPSTTRARNPCAGGTGLRMRRGAPTQSKEDARVHCAVLNDQPGTPGHAPPTRPPRTRPANPPPPATTNGDTDDDSGTRTRTAPTRGHTPHRPADVPVHPRT